MADDAFATGHCLCGAVQFKIKAEPVMTGQCHCKDCQRASGTGHMSLAFFKADDIEVSGETASYAVTADSGNTNTPVSYTHLTLPTKEDECSSRGAREE